MSRTLSWLGPVELVEDHAMLRLPRTSETAPLERCVPVRLTATHILVSLPDATSFPVGSTVEVYAERGALVIRRHPPLDAVESEGARTPSAQSGAWRAIRSPRRWNLGLGTWGFDFTAAARPSNERRGR
jgi:hypothetical protein